MACLLKYDSVSCESKLASEFHVSRCISFLGFDCNSYLRKEAKTINDYARGLVAFVLFFR